MDILKGKSMKITDPKNKLVFVGKYLKRIHTSKGLEIHIEIGDYVKKFLAKDCMFNVIK